MSGHGIVDVEWYGLSANGDTALGYGKRKPLSAPAPAKGKAVEHLELTPHYNRWFSIRNKKLFRVLDKIARPDASPYYRLLSRDGKKLLQKQHDNSVQVVDLQTGKLRPLTFGGVPPMPLQIWPRGRNASCKQVIRKILSSAGEDGRAFAAAAFFRTAI